MPEKPVDLADEVNHKAHTQRKQHDLEELALIQELLKLRREDGFRDRGRSHQGGVIGGDPEDSAAHERYVEQRSHGQQNTERETLPLSGEHKRLDRRSREADDAPDNETVADRVRMNLHKRENVQHSNDHHQERGLKDGVPGFAGFGEHGERVPSHGLSIHFSVEGGLAVCNRWRRTC